jgi:hypothetical protein
VTSTGDSPRIASLIHKNPELQISASSPMRDQAHLRRILRDYETRHNQHRPHRSLHAAAPLKPLPEPVGPGHYRVRKRRAMREAIMTGWRALERFLRTDPRDVGCERAMDVLDPTPS